MNTSTLALRRTALVREERFAHGVELREDAAGHLRFAGVASTVEQPYSVNDAFGEFTETMARGAFDQTVSRGDVRLLVNHDGVPLARTKSGTLTLAADPHLRAEAPLDPGNPTVAELRSAMGRGDIDQMSIAFRAVRQEWNKDYTERTIHEAKLFDVSIVTHPANTNTSASLRSLLTTDLDGPDQIRAAISKLAEMLPADEPEPYDESTLEAMSRYWAHRSRDPLASEQEGLRYVH